MVHKIQNSKFKKWKWNSLVHETGGYQKYQLRQVEKPGVERKGQRIKNFA